MWSYATKFLHHVVPQVMRPARTLWNQIIGFLFLVFALWGVPSTVRNYREFNLVRLILAVSFVAIMVSFGIGSFLRARRASRS